MQEDENNIPAEGTSAAETSQQTAPQAPAQTPTTAPPVTDSKEVELPKEDWFLTRVKAPDLSTKNLFELYGKEGFAEFKNKEDYWNNKKVQDIFSNTYGSEAKMRFDEAYDNSKKEYAKFQLGEYQRSQTGHELLRDDLSAMRFDATMRFSNMAGTMKQGMDWSAPTKDYRENFSAIKVKELDENGVESYVVKEYSPELLKELENDPTFGGLAYSDAFYNLDPNEGVNGLYFNTIHDGRVLDEATGQLKDVRNDQVVSRWDLDTGPTSVMGMFDVNLGRFFKNNKLEADGVLDYAKILVKSPMNMAVNVMDTAVQMTRAAVAGGYGIADIFTDDDLDVRASETYKWLTTKGVQLKGHNTSMTREAIQDGFFGSLEAALTTTADVALQIALAGGLGRAGAGIPGILDKGLQGKALQQAQTRAAEVFVRGTLTAMAIKDTYNEALENGYTTKEASLITGAMGVAMWKATKYASYIFGDYEAKLLRQNIKTAMQTEQQGMLKTLFASVEPAAVNAAETKSKYALSSMQEAVSKVFGSITKGLPPSRMLYAARQEGFEEMTEELFQDGVKQAASAYGYLINNAHAAGKGRYLSIFDDGYFKDAAERYATSGVAGAMGGPMGMIGNKVNISPVTSASSVTDILMSGEKDELISVLEEMKNEGALGPKSLSTEYNASMEAFEPIIKGSGSESLSDMVFNTYLHDINVIDTFINKGMFGQAKDRIQAEGKLKDFVDNNAMRKDYVKLMGNMLEFHNKTGISMSVYEEIDDMREDELAERLPVILKREQSRIKVAREKIQELKDSVKDIAPAGKDSKKEEKPKTDDKKEDKKKVIGETEESKLTRLEKEVKLSSTVSDSDIVTMLTNYRKIRAISTGAAAEYYLLQNDMADNTMLGAKYNRESKYADLGEEPFKDMLMAMRFRSLEDEKIHAQTEIKAAELEAKVLEITDTDDESVAELISIIKKDGYSMLSEKALKAITKLYQKVDIKETSTAFDADHEDSIFEKGIDGKADDNDMLHLYREIMGLSADNFSVLENDVLGLELTPAVVRKFFKEVAKDIRKVNVPVWEEDNDEGFIPGDAYQGLIDSINTKGSTRLKKTLALSGNILQDVKRMHDEASQYLALGTFYKQEPFKKKGINSLFKRGSGKELTRETLVNSGLSVVKMLIDSGHEGIYTFSDYSKLDDVLTQIDVRMEMAKVLSTLTESKEGKANHYLTMLTSFRKNVLDIIDFKYKHGSKQDTEIEEHSYKDYTTTSDFFVDFVYDPINYSEIMSKDVSLRTDEDVEVERDITRASALLRPSIVKSYDITDPTVDDLIITEVPIDQELLFAYLDNPLSGGPEMYAGNRNTFPYIPDLKEAVRFMETAKVMQVPESVFGRDSSTPIPVFFDGAFKLMVAKWLFNKTRGIIETVADKATVLPYLQSKKNDSDFEIRVMRNLIENDDIPELKELIDVEAPEYALAVRQDIEKLSPTELGALNITVEHALYKIYNNIGSVQRDEEEAKALRGKIDFHISKVNTKLNTSMHKNSRIEDAADHVRTLSVLIGALTTDFTPFYSKFKREIENMGPYDRIVVAAQEHAAKHSGAYLYSPRYRAMADRWAANRRFDKKTNISAVYITGVAGSGKSSAFVQLGLKLAVEILQDQGAENTAVLPVSKFEEQIKIISSSVGEMSNGLEGLSVEGLLSLLKDAVHSKNQDAIDKLTRVGIIVIDEATHVQGVSLEGNFDSEVDQLNELLRIFNEKINPTGHKIGLVMMGDPKQSGATQVGNEGILYNTSTDVRRTHPIAYMNFSFRSRNNYLVDSLLAVGQSIKNIVEGTSSSITITDGTRYGTTAGKYYGMRVVDAADKNSSEEFFKLMNDETLVNNINANIQKTIDANASRAAGSPEVSFKVLLSPADKVSFDSTPSKMKTLMETEGYGKYFSVVAAEMVGGSEANYVIGEIVNPENKYQGESSFVDSIAKKLNTLATRAFDYVVIVNRNDNIVVPTSSASVLVPDGNVIIPDNALDASAKEKLKQNYLEIFKNIVSGPTAAKVVPVVVPGEPYVIPKDTFAVNFKNVMQFTVGEKALLTNRGIMAAFRHLSEEDSVKLANYLEDAQALLSREDSENSDIRAAYIDNMDNLARDLKGKISQESFEELIGLQVFAESLYDNAAVSRIVSANIDVALASLGMDPKITEFSIMPNLTVEQYVAKAENTLSDISLHGTYKNLFEASLVRRIDKESFDRYEALMELFVTSLIPEGSEVNVEGLDPEDQIPDLLDAMVLAKALFLETALPVKQPDVDIVTIARQLDDYANWASGFSRESVVALLQQFEPGSTSTTVNLPKQAKDLFSLGYSSDSIKKALYDATKMTLERMDAEAAEKKNYTDAIAELSKMKAKLGINSNIVNAMELYREIGNIEAKFQKKNYGKELSSEQLAEVKDIITISNLWNTLYRGTTSTFGNDEDYGVGFMDRDLNHKETLDDYIKEFNKTGGVHTVGVTAFNLKDQAASVPDPASDKKHVVLTPKEALAQFNYNNDDTHTPPSKAGIRVVSRGGKIDVFLMATTSTTKYVLSQLDNTTTSPAAKALMTELRIAVDNPALGGFDFNGMRILDIDIPKGVKDFMYTRPGGIVTQKSIEEDLKKGPLLEERYLISPTKGEDGEYKMLNAKDLRGAVNTSNNVYVQTHKAVAGESSSAGNLRGEAFFLYSANKSTSLDSQDIFNNMKNGRGLNTKARIEDTAGQINTQLGLMKITLKAPLHDLGRVLKENKSISMGQFVSHFSLALQQHFIEYAGGYTIGQTTDAYVRENFVVTSEFKEFIATTSVGDKVDYSIDGAVRTFMVTDRLIAILNGLNPGSLFTDILGDVVTSFTYTDKSAQFFSEMAKDLEVHYSAADEDYRKKVAAVLEAMKGSVELKTILDDFAKSFMINKLRDDAPDKAIKFDILYPSKSRGYIFNVNEYLRYHPESVLRKLDALASVANYTLKPSILKGQTVYAGTINEVFMREMPEALQVSALGIKVPSIMISESGTASISSAIRMLSKPKESAVTFTVDQDNLLTELELIMPLDTVGINNKLLSLGEVALNDMLNEMAVIELLIKGDSSYADLYNMLTALRPKMVRSVQTLKESGIGQIVPNEFLSEYAQTTDYTSPFRQVMAEMLIHYKGPNDVLISSLEILGMMGQEQEEQLVEHLKQYIEDKDMLDILDNCKFN